MATSMKRVVPAFLVAMMLSIGVVAQAPTRSWRLASARSVGLDEKNLEDFDRELATGKYGHIDSFLAIRHGAIAYERTYRRDYDAVYREDARKRSELNAHDPSGPLNYFNPWWHPYYRRGELHTLQSISKCFMSAVIGIAVTRREFPSLDTPALDFFDASRVANLDDRKRRMAIRHLLTMTTGLEWTEDSFATPDDTIGELESSFDWAQFTIDQPMAAEPGTTFSYNSGAIQILAHVFRVATGQDVEEYAVRHLFTPLGIEHYYWKRTPVGLVVAESGLYLHPRDIAKLGALYLNRGTWDGRRIVSTEWVDASLTPKADAVGRKYGYNWWLYEYGAPARAAWVGIGFGGQLLIVLPDLDVVAVLTAWNVLPDGPRLTVPEAIERVARAVTRR